MPQIGASHSLSLQSLEIHLYGQSDLYAHPHTFRNLRFCRDFVEIVIKHTNGNIHHILHTLLLKVFLSFVIASSPQTSRFTSMGLLHTSPCLPREPWQRMGQFLVALFRPTRLAVGSVVDHYTANTVAIIHTHTQDSRKLVNEAQRVQT